MLDLMNEILILAGCEPIYEDENVNNNIVNNSTQNNVNNNEHILGDNSGSLGECFDGYENDPYGAIAKLRKEGKGYIPNAIYKEKVGWIGFAYGWTDELHPDKGFGIIHILKKHGEADLLQIPYCIREGLVDLSRKGTEGKIDINWNGLKIILGLRWKEGKYNIVVTSFTK